MILVDSSVWIDAWRGGKTVARLTPLIETGDAVLNPLIRTEILQGARDRRHQEMLKGLLSPIGVEALPEGLWEEAPLYYLRARERGVTLTTIDCLIAVHSLLLRCPLWSLNQVFRRAPDIQRVAD